MYKVVLSKKADKQLSKLNPNTAKKIVTWMKKNLENCEDPRQKGKGLTGDKSGEWRYRVGDYRIIAEIRDNEVIILVLEVGHRKEIYQ